jgi:hydroxyacid-oxoacid transhydrogenase
MTRETAFEMAASSVRFGAGVTCEVGVDLAELGAHRVLLVTDSIVRDLPPVRIAMESLHENGIDAVVYDRVRVEPTDASFLDAIGFARERAVDAFVAVGGGSTIDTAKVVNLYTSCPADFLDYVNPPIGKGLPVPGPLKPLMAIPTTAGTGSETTGVAIFDLESLHAKTGIAHRRLKPTLGYLDPRMVAQFLVRAVEDPGDDEARANMLLAAAYAGIGFGNAGVHLPHGMSYPVSGHVGDYRAPGYAVDHPLVPHGVSVILNAPAVFRFTASANPVRHLHAADALGVDVSRARAEDAGKILADRITWFMERLKVPNGLRAVGYSRSDIPTLVQGTLPQHRVTKLAPRPAGPEELSALFDDAMVAY